MITSLAIHPAFDELSTSLAKLDALLKIAATANIREHTQETIFNYIWVAEEILEKAKGSFKNLIET